MTQTLSDADVRERLWKAIEHERIGMLGASGDNHHFQPMTAFVEPQANRLWFYTWRDTDLAQAAAAGAEAAFVFQSDRLYACVDGRISLDHDPERIARYWNPHVAAWYPEGRDDPRLTLLRMDVEAAGVWITEAGPVKYALEVARANIAKDTPDLGQRRDVGFH